MNFREKVKAIVLEAGVKKLTRQLHSRPRNISKAVDRLTQRDYKRTSGKARSGDRKAIKQLAQMHQQSTIQPVLYPKKSNPAPKRPLQALRADEQQSPDEKVKAIRAKAKAEGRELNDDERTEVVVQAGRKMRLKKSKPKAIRQPENQTENSSHAFYQKVKDLLETGQAAPRGRRERLDHYKQRQAMWRDAQRQDAYNKAKARWDRSQTTNEDSNHPFYQKVKELSRARGRKSQSLVDSTNGNGEESNGGGAIPHPMHTDKFKNADAEGKQKMLAAYDKARTIRQTPQDKQVQAAADKLQGRFSVKMPPLKKPDGSK